MTGDLCHIAMRTNGTLTWLLGDHLGSTTITANADGTLASGQTYTAWGETRGGSASTDRQYTGQISESQLGIYFYNARYYDPYLAQFTQPDSIIPDQYNPFDWNRYTYARYNPVKCTDPSGHCPICVVAALVLSAIVLTGDIPRLGPGDAGNITDLVIAGLQHEGHANIVDEGLESLQNDPSVQDAQDRIVGEIVSLSEYGERPFSINQDISDSFTTDGPNGNWKEAAVTNNQAFWMVRNGTISATNTTVSVDGTISTTWHVHDEFNFDPGPDRSKDYNYWATLYHYFYADPLGIETVVTDAYWNETIPPQEKK